MASLMEELLDVLGKEEKQYQELITLATEKTDAVVQGNIEHLTDVTTREQDAASVLLNLSNKRNRVLTDMATVLGQSPEEMTILTSSQKNRKHLPDSVTGCLRPVLRCSS